MVSALQNQLRRAVKDDLVYEREYGDLFVYVYTQRAVMDRIWNDTTRMCRGLILDRDGNIVARPFDKFFNLFERVETEPKNLPKGRFVVEEKLDGSMGTIFHHNGEWNVSTKGSLESDQANYARELLPSYDFSQANPNETIITEIIYPENRIVVDYGDFVGLRLLAVRNRHTGVEQPAGRIEILAKQMGMECRRIYNEKKFGTMILQTSGFDNIAELPFEAGTEGFICRWPCGFRVKVKNPWYLRIHKLLDMRSQKRILELLEGGEYRAVLETMPKELQKQFDDIYASLRGQLHQSERELLDNWDRVANVALDVETKKAKRRDFAFAVQRLVEPEYRGAMFSKLDGLGEVTELT